MGKKGEGFERERQNLRGSFLFFLYDTLLTSPPLSPPHFPSPLSSLPLPSPLFPHSSPSPHPISPLPLFATKSNAAFVRLVKDLGMEGKREETLRMDKEEGKGRREGEVE